MNKVLPGIVNAPYKIRNDTLHKDLEMEMSITSSKSAQIHEQRFNGGLIRRLKTMEPFELAQ